MLRCSAWKEWAGSDTPSRAPRNGEMIVHVRILTMIGVGLLFAAKSRNTDPTDHIKLNPISGIFLIDI